MELGMLNVIGGEPGTIGAIAEIPDMGGTPGMTAEPVPDVMLIL